MLHRTHPEFLNDIVPFLEQVDSENKPLALLRDSDQFSHISYGHFEKDKGIIQVLDVLSN